VSSNAYSAHLTPDPWLRIIVLTSGRLLVAAGLVVTLTLDLDVVLRAVACCIWFAIGWVELAQLERGMKVCKAVRLSSNGEIAVLDNEQQWRPAVLQTGSLVLQNLAWLRLRTANGDHFVELLRGNSRQSEEWRRLQVIWRHVGASS
jgi:hypothetical protein